MISPDHILYGLVWPGQDPDQASHATFMTPDVAKSLNQFLSDHFRVGDRRNGPLYTTLRYRPTEYPMEEIMVEGKVQYRAVVRLNGEEYELIGETVEEVVEAMQEALS